MKPICSLLVVFLLFVMTTTALASEAATMSMNDVVMYDDIVDAVQPYLDAVARVNAKYKLEISVPENSLQDIYECIEDSTPDEFEVMLDELCAAVQSNSTFVDGEVHLIYVLLSPYQAVIDKLNAELGTTLTITDGMKYEVYRAYKGKSADQVEACLRSQLNTVNSSE